VMMLLDCPLSGSQKLGSLYRAINQLIASDGWQAVAGQFAGQIVVLAQDNEHLKAMAARVQERVALTKLAVNGNPRVGVSGLQQGADKVRCAYDHCRDVLEITRRLDPHGRVFYFNDLGYLHTIYHAGSESVQGNPYVPLLRR